MNNRIKLYNGDCLSFLKEISDNSVDSIVTDPPAGISFMGKDWDSNKGGRDQWIAWLTEVMSECHRVLKPGGHALVWAIPRTSHWTATALENAGFEIRDVVTHLFGSGFPKSRDISKDFDKLGGAKREVVGTYKVPGMAKDNVTHGAQNRTKFEFEKLSKEPVSDLAKQWEGWGTALKPASEHWVLCRKPLSEKTVAANVLKHGTGGINIDASRVPHQSEADRASATPQGKVVRNNFAPGLGKEGTETNRPDTSMGRFPANLILDEEAAILLDEQTEYLHGAGSKREGGKSQQSGEGGLLGVGNHAGNGMRFGDTGGASRFFYVAKASKKDKGEGNTHPTVKSTALMTYLIKLITPPGGTVLDPFMGSGSTGVAAIREDFGFVGIEMCQDYFQISKKRLYERENI